MNNSFLDESTSSYSDLELFNTTSAPPIHPDDNTASVSSYIVLTFMSVGSGLFLFVGLSVCFQNIFRDCRYSLCSINVKSCFKKKENNQDIVIELTEVIVADPFDATEKCSICLEDISEGDKLGSLPCGHKHFHKTCVDRWLTVSGYKTCPLCRNIVV